MYYLLNYIPNILFVVLSIIPIKLEFSIFIALYFFVVPIYLVVINKHFLFEGDISQIKGIICMISSNTFNVLFVIISNKIKTGTYFSDTPEIIFLLMWGIPCLITILSLLRR